MALKPTERRWLAGALTVAGFTIVVDQLSLLAFGLLPPDPGLLPWRFGAVNLAVGRVTPLLVADALLLAAVALVPGRWWPRVLGLLHLLAAVGLLGALALFALDAVEMRGMVALDRRDALVVNAGRVLLVGGLAALLAAWFGIRLLRLAGRQGGRRGVEEVLVVGGPSA